MNRFWNQIIHLGDDPRLPDYLRQKLQLTNLIGSTIMLLSLLTVFWEFLGTGQLYSSPFMSFLATGMGLLLNYSGMFKVTRWIYCVVPVTLITFEAALITPPGQAVPPIRLMILSMVALPPILFDSRERKSLTVATLIPVVLFAMFEFLNEQMRQGSGVHSSTGPLFRAIAFIFATALILSAIFYLRHVNYLSARRIADLLSDVRQRNKELQTSLETIEEQNSEIRDSIQYARRIQEAILPRMEALTELYPVRYFVHYRPKDIVSGDFYWLDALPQRLRVAAVDCTGHGVPGAFMSVLGNTVLNQIAHLRPDALPNEMLQMLNANVVRALQQDSPSTGNVNLLDGMDIALAQVDFQTGKLFYSGAHRPIWVLRKGELTEIKGSRRPIGGKFFQDVRFDLNEMPLGRGDRLYLFSDGITDQVGGPDRRKFTPRRLSEFLLATAQLPLADQGRLLERELKQWTGTQEQLDDQLLLGLEWI